MFSFFRRSKKDAEGGSSKEFKEKKNKEKEFAKESSSSPGSSHKDMCKNKPPTQKVEIAPQGGCVSAPSVVAEFGLRENDEGSASAAGDKVTTDVNDPNPSNSKLDVTHKSLEMNGGQVKPFSYASILKKPEVDIKQQTRNVKPCGHGTVAIQPRIPPQNNAKKRENSVTPPESPREFLKNLYFKQKSIDADDASGDKFPKRGSLDKNANDTTVLGASMKIFVNLPPIASPAAATQDNGDDDEKKNLINQEAKFQGQLNELSKQLSSRDAEANKLRFQMEELQRDVFAKSAGMDRLQAELQAAHKESEYVRQKLKHLEEDLDGFRKKNSELSEEIQEKTNNYNQIESTSNAKIHELEDTIKDLKKKIETLELQIESLKQEKDKLEKDHEALLVQRDSETKLMEETVEKAKEEKKLIEKKWEEEFEKLRTVNMTKEQQMMDDFEWKLREVEKICKKKLEDKEKRAAERLQDAYIEAESKMKEAEDLMNQIEHLKVYQTEVEQLRGLTKEQEEALKLMKEQQEQMKAIENSLKAESKRLRTMVDMEKENLQHMQLTHSRELQDRERKLQNTLDQKRTEIAMYWEERLLHEIRRLKTELEQLHNEEKYHAMNSVRQQKEEELNEAKKNWESKIDECLKEISTLKDTLQEKEVYYHDEMIQVQSKTDVDVLELRRIMDKIDMNHHDRFEKLVRDHEEEIERITEESEQNLKEAETTYHSQVCSLKATLELVREQMEIESQQKLQNLIAQHRAQLDTQWQNLIHQKSEAVKLVEDEYVTKYKTLEEQFYTQQKSHESREIELLKTIDSLKNEVTSKDSTVDDLQNNLETLEGGIQVLNNEIAQQAEQLVKSGKDSDYKMKSLQEQLENLQSQQEQDRATYEAKLAETQSESKSTIDHLQRKCQCLTKLFEEVRARYERRESRQEDLNVITDLKQIIAEQEKDLACLNEEKRYFQMRLMSLEKSLDEEEEHFVDSEDFESGKHKEINRASDAAGTNMANGFAAHPLNQTNGPPFCSVPPPMATIPECDDCDEC